MLYIETNHKSFIPLALATEINGESEFSRKYVPNVKNPTGHTYLHNAFAELERVLARDTEIDHGQGEASVNQQPSDHCGHIHAQTASRLRQVINGHQVPGHQAADPERRVPDVTRPTHTQRSASATR